MAATVLELARTADRIAATTSKREKVRLLAEFLARLEGDELVLATRYFTGGVFPVGDPRTLSVGGAAFGELVRAQGIDDAELSRIWRSHGDSGDWFREVLVRAGHSGGSALGVAELDASFKALSGAGGAKARTSLLRALIDRVGPDEARFIAKLINGEMRIGLREGLVEEAIVVAFEAEPAQVSRAMMLLGDLGEVAALAAKRTLHEAAPRWFVPLRPMLATPVADAAEAIARLGDEVWVEDKYDGIRCQLHRRGGRVALFSRDLKDVTAQFPEVTLGAALLARDVILDGEVLAFRDGLVMPFRSLQTRLGRVAPDASVMEAVPVIYVAWDLLVEEETVLLDAPLRERRARLEALGATDRIALAHLESVRGAAEVDRRFADARARLNEGLLLKQPGSPYTPGRRGMNWLKLKRPMDTLDVVVIGAEWGHGKRRGVLSDVTFGVRVDGTDEHVAVGKAYSGLTDAEIADMTKLLLDITITDRGHYRTVRPEIVLEVAFDAVQPSSRHRSGYALRFPRIAHWRHEKPVSEIDTLSRVRQLAEARDMAHEQRIDVASA